MVPPCQISPTRKRIYIYIYIYLPHPPPWSSLAPETEYMLECSTKLTERITAHRISSQFLNSIFNGLPSPLRPRLPPLRRQGRVHHALETPHTQRPTLNLQGRGVPVFVLSVDDTQRQVVLPLSGAGRRGREIRGEW